MSPKLKKILEEVDETLKRVREHKYPSYFIRVVEGPRVYFTTPHDLEKNKDNGNG